jgi:hypothetical protein
MSKNNQIVARDITLPASPVYSEDVEAAIQDTLALLAEVDRGYELRREAIKKSSFSVVQKRRLRTEVGSLHRKDREPYVLRLADLHYRMVRASLFRTFH